MEYTFGISIDCTELEVTVEYSHDAGDYWTPPDTYFQYCLFDRDGQDVTEIVERWAVMTKTDLNEYLYDEFLNSHDYA